MNEVELGKQTSKKVRKRKGEEVSEALGIRTNLWTRHPVSAVWCSVI